MLPQTPGSFVRPDVLVMPVGSGQLQRVPASRLSPNRNEETPAGTETELPAATPQVAQARGSSDPRPFNVTRAMRTHVLAELDQLFLRMMAIDDQSQHAPLEAETQLFGLHLRNDPANTTSYGWMLLATHPLVRLSPGAACGGPYPRILIRRAFAALIHGLVNATCGCFPCFRAGDELDVDGDARSGQLHVWSRRCAALWCGGDEYMRLEHSFSRRTADGSMLLPWPLCCAALSFRKDI